MTDRGCGVARAEVDPKDVGHTESLDRRRSHAVPARPGNERCSAPMCQ
jgi:hypothetical protein